MPLVGKPCVVELDNGKGGALDGRPGVPVTTPVPDGAG